MTVGWIPRVAATVLLLGVAVGIARRAADGGLGDDGAAGLAITLHFTGRWPAVRRARPRSAREPEPKSWTSARHVEETRPNATDPGAHVPLLDDLHHLAFLTADMDRLIGFYTRVFEAG
jgi:hypothetical protein